VSQLRHAGHSRSKNGVASLAYVPGIHVFRASARKDVDGRGKPGHDEALKLPVAFLVRLEG
jgi:hypothetical protein